MPYFIYFDVPPADIDVNIHPTKTEIKFENEQAIWQILLAAVRESIGRFNAIPTIVFDTEGRPTDMPVFNPNVESHPSAPKVEINTHYNPFDTHSGAPSYERRSAATPLGWERLYDGAAKPDAQIRLDSQEEPVHGGSQTSLAAQDLFPVEGGFEGATFFQYRGQFIFTSIESGLLLIDQHRAHVRILYNKYITQLGSAPMPSQRYLFPEVVQLTAAQASTFALVHDDLARLGFDVGDLGGGNVSVNGYPEGFEGIDPQELLTELLATAADHGDLPADKLLGQFATTLANAAAIPRGQVLSDVEMRDLVIQLFATTTPQYTPDGHAITAIIGHDEIEKLFR